MEVHPDNATVNGTEPTWLVGAINNFTIKHRDYGFSLSLEKLFNVNETAREDDSPNPYIVQDEIHSDTYMDKALKLLHH